jgi:hypothetical protein
MSDDIIAVRAGNMSMMTYCESYGGLGRCRFGGTCAIACSEDKSVTFCDKRQPSEHLLRKRKRNEISNLEHRT